MDECSSFQGLDMVFEVILQERGDEVVTVIVSFVFAKRDWHCYFHASFD